MSQKAILGSISPLIPAAGDVENSVKFYEDKLGFRITHQEGNPMRMAIVKRDSAEIFIVKSDYIPLAESIALRISVKQIEKYYDELLTKGGDMIHPNGKLETKPWGVKEFVVIDLAGICITFYELINSESSS